MLQDGAQHLVHGAVLIGESLHAHGINFGIVTNVVRLNGIQPVSGAVFARLIEHGEGGGMIGQQIVEQLGLLLADLLHAGQPFIDRLLFFSL